MRTAPILLVLAILLLVLPAGADEGFVSLFNGRNLDGWVVEGSPEGFRVLDGCLHSDGGRGGNWIHTDRPYGNFVLRLEWMLSKTGNSGIFIRMGGEKQGFEVQLLAPWTPYRDDLHCTGSIYGLVPAHPRPDETTLRWRTAEVTAAWRHITVKIDGVVTAQADYDQVAGMKDMALTGFVGMQDSHTGAGEWVKFRNIEIKDLDRDPAFLAQAPFTDPEIGKMAYDAAVRLGPPMVPALLRLVREGEPAVAHGAGLALERIVLAASAPASPDRAFPVRRDLLACLAAPGDSAAPDRLAAARLLGIVGLADARTVATLKQAVLAGGPVGAAALEAMQRIPGRAMSDGVIGLIRRVPPAQRPAVLLALGERRDPVALAVLADTVARGSGEAQVAAIRALGMLGSAKALPALQTAALNASEALKREISASLLAIRDALPAGDATRGQVEEAIKGL